MKMEIFSIYDSVSHVYNQPFFLINKGAALRQFKNMCQDPDTQISLNPSDFTLYHLGSWDNTKCTMDKKDPKSLGNGIEFTTMETEEITIT